MSLRSFVVTRWGALSAAAVAVGLGMYAGASAREDSEMKAVRGALLEREIEARVSRELARRRGADGAAGAGAREAAAAASGLGEPRGSDAGASASAAAAAALERRA